MSELEETNNTNGMDITKIIYMNPIRAKIVGLLILYRELSYTDLSLKLGRSKSTIHPHLKKLEDIGVIRVSREEPRGGTPAKFYEYISGSARRSIVGKIDKSKGISKETAEKIIITQKNKMIELRGVINMYIKFWESLEENLEEAPKIIKEMPTIMADYADTRFFLTREEYELWYKRYFDLSVEFGEYLAEESVKRSWQEKPFYFIASFLPLKQIYEKTRLKKDD